MSGLTRKLALGWSEGPRAALARFLDRAADTRRAASHPEVSQATLGDRHGGRVPVLNLLGVPLRRSSGGVELQFMARLAHQEQVRPVACLAPSPGGWRLEVAAGRERSAIVISARVGESRAAHLARALETAWSLLGPKGLHIENPAGLDLGVLAEAAARMPSLLSAHDLSLFCPRPHLLPVTADGDCHWTARTGCALCDPGANDLPRLLASLRGTVFPSPFLRDAFSRRLDSLARPPASIVTPAVELPPRRAWRGSASIRHVAFVGSVRPHKGAELLLAIAPRLSAMGLRLSAYGGGDGKLIAALRAAAVRATGYYRAGSLSRRLAADAVDLVLLLSLWPESHSLAFDECVAAGVPVLAFDRGALGERLRSGGGVVVDPAGGGEGVLAAIGGLSAGELTPAPSAEQLPTPWSAADAIAEVYRRLGWLDPC